MILVTGATGNVGTELVNLLAADDHPVRALTRYPEKAELPDGVEVVGGDLEKPDTLEPALFDDVDGVFVVPPGYGPEGPVHETNLVHAVRGTGVRKLVKLSTSGVEFGATDPLSLGHRSGEDVVTGSGLDWVILRPGTFMVNVAQHARSVAAEDAVYVTEGDPVSAMIHPRDIAAVAERALLDDDQVGRTLPLTGAEAIEPSDVASIIGAVLGRDVRTVERTRAEVLEEFAARGWGGPRLDALLELKRQSAAWDWQVFDTVERVTGQTPLTLRDWVGENARLFAA